MAFDAVLARDLSLETALAYAEPTHRIGNVAFRVTTTPCGLLVAFAGTDDWKDLLDDLKAFMARTASLGWIHAGFASEWDAAKPILLRILAANRLPVRFTGHSLGAAHALIASAWFKQSGFEVLDCYTFGCPRVGGGIWADIYRQLGVPTYRVVNGRDGITMVPIGENWRHVGAAVYLDAGALIVPTRSSGLSWNPFTLFGLIGDHGSMGEYTLALARLASRPKEVAETA